MWSPNATPLRTLALACALPTARASGDSIFDTQDGWSIAAIVMLSMLGALILTRVCMAFVSCQMDDEEAAETSAKGEATGN